MRAWRDARWPGPRHTARACVRACLRRVCVLRRVLQHSTGRVGVAGVLLGGRASSCVRRGACQQDGGGKVGRLRVLVNAVLLVITSFNISINSACLVTVFGRGRTAPPRPGAPARRAAPGRGGVGLPPLPPRRSHYVIVEVVIFYTCFCFYRYFFNFSNLYLVLSCNQSCCGVSCGRAPAS